MTKARDLADLGNKTSLDEINDAYDAGALSNRNLIINGAMQVAQRGTSFTGVTSDTYTVDRFQYTEGSGGGSVASTITQSSDSPDQFGNSLKLEVTTADTLSGGENVTFRYRSEGRDGQRLKFGTSSAEKFTVSFWAKASVAGTYSLQIFAPARSALSSYTINSANTWEYKTITFNGDTSVALPNTSASGFEVVWHLDAGSSDITSAYDWGNTGAFRAVTGQVNLMANTGNTWQITGVQLEVGDTATPFEHRSYGDELAKCQRYFQVLGNNQSNGAIASGYFHGTTSFRGQMSYLQRMRVAPTGSTSTVSGFILQGTGGNFTPTSIAVTVNFTEALLVVGIGPAQTAGQGANLLSAGNTAIYLDAEL
jgi:hypothetical protein